MIHSLFPTPLFQTTLRPFTAPELEFIKGLKRRPNVANSISENSYIFNSPEMESLLFICDEAIKKYSETVISPLSEISLYITQSWANFTDSAQYHHPHTHQNSVVSGVLYVETDPDDRIYFHRPDVFEALSFGTKDNNQWNSKSWYFDVKATTLLLFPSSLTHRVEVKKSPGTRISISFNTFVKGTLGSNLDLTELYLK